MQRDLRRLTDTHFDVVVVGGGIYGTTAAWDASLRGLSVALIDRADFGSGTSFNSAKTVHGGVRMLQSGNVLGLRQFVRERRALSRIAPHLIHPMPFVIPTYHSFSRHRWFMRMGFALNDLLASDRNDGVDPANHLPHSRLLSRSECLRLNPFIDPTGVTGGIKWFDCQMHNSDRVNLSFVLSAEAKGAIVANYVECTGANRHNGRICGITVRDRLKGEQFDIRARVVLNAAGPWAPSLLTALAPDAQPTLPSGLSKAMNLILAKPMTHQHAVGGQSNYRLLFLAPWRGFTLAGTSHAHFRAVPDSLAVTQAEVEEFLQDINNAFPGLSAGLPDIRLVHRGLLPSQEDNGTGVTLLKQSAVRDHRQEGLPGLISILGVRYTTARHTAQQAIDTVFSVLGLAPPPCQTHNMPLIGGTLSDLRTFFESATDNTAPAPDHNTRERLARTYGSTHTRLLETVQTTPEDGEPLSVECAITRAEVRHAAREEMAVHLSDAILRRTEAGSAGQPDDTALRTAAKTMAQELNWSTERIESEIADTQRVYRLPL
ncbi:MAG: glycerol-3-phosphate dehydrogenase/oxidase [Acidobacteriota bacterium]|nr:glycerol-3-phosphate dehydrogenase/oxidase [Acidobacteriota bacterium]